MTDSIEKPKVTEYIPGEQDDNPNYYVGTTVQNWFGRSVYFYLFEKYYEIYVDLISDDMLDDLVFNFDLRFPICICYNDRYIDHTDMPTKLTFDLLMKKLDGMTKLILIVDNLKITYLPDSLTSITVNRSHYNNNIDLSQCINLKEYYLNSDKNDCIIPYLPEGVEKVHISCSHSINSSSINFPSTVQEIVIKGNFSNGDLWNWPCNLKILKIICSEPFSVSMLPHTLEDLYLSCDTYPNFIDLPPNLIYFAFKLYVKYEYILDIPDSVKDLRLKYTNYPYIKNLPKSCKNFSYEKCPDDVFKELCKVHKGKGCKITKTPF
jgi:hypothetical protein